MAYTYTTEKYGPLPWQTMLVGRSTSGSTDKYAYMYVPGGGWGLRDPLPFVSGQANYAGRTSLYGGAFDNSSSTAHEQATVFVINVASESHNTPTTLVHQAFGGYNPTNSSGPTPTIWGTGNTYAINDRVVTSGNIAVCRKAHAGSTSDQDPALGSDGAPVGANAEEYWNISYNENCLLGRIPNRGEGSPGSLAQSAVDVQRAIAFVRRNAEQYGISTDKVLLEGSSAGAQAAGLAAYSPPLGYGHDYHPTASHRFGTDSDCHPNGLVLSIAACQQNDYALQDGNLVSQGLFLAFMNTLFGRGDLTEFNANSAENWQSIPQNQKKALDPYWAAISSGWYVPTYFEYYTDFGYDDIWSRSEISNGVRTSDYSAWAISTTYNPGDKVSNGGDYWYCIQSTNGVADAVTEPGTGSSFSDYWADTSTYAADSNGNYGVQIHHSQNGLLYLKDFTATQAAGGLNIDDGIDGDIRLSLKPQSGASTTRHVYHTYAATANPANRTDLTLSGTGDQKKLTIADDMLGFFTPARLTTYI